MRIVRDTGKPIAQVARGLGINEGTLGNSVASDREEREQTDGLLRLDIAEPSVGLSGPEIIGPVR